MNVLKLTNLLLIGLRDVILYFNKSNTPASNVHVLKHSPRIAHTITPPDRKEWTYDKVYKHIHEEIKQATTITPNKSNQTN